MFMTVAKNVNIGHYPEPLKCEDCCVVGRDGCNFVEISDVSEGTCCLHFQTNFYQSTWRYIPENSILYSHRLENLMSHI
jgi:hypothetical protein